MDSLDQEIDDGGFDLLDAFGNDTPDFIRVELLGGAIKLQLCYYLKFAQ